MSQLIPEIKILDSKIQPEGLKFGNTEPCIKAYLSYFAHTRGLLILYDVESGLYYVFLKVLDISSI